MRLIKYTDLPTELRSFAQTVIALKSLDDSKETQKGPALKALQKVLAGEKALIAVSNQNFFQYDINPQQHPEFDPKDQSPEIKEVLAAQKAVKEANARLAAAVADAKLAGKIKITPKDSIRLEVLGEVKVKPIKKKYAAQIRALRTKGTAEGTTALAA